MWGWEDGEVCIWLVWFEGLGFEFEVLGGRRVRGGYRRFLVRFRERYCWGDGGEEEGVEVVIMVVNGGVL